VKFSVQLPTDRVEPAGEYTSLAAITEMARAAEDAGFDACWVTEHPFPSDAWLATGGHHSLDPFVALTAAAAATTRLRLHTNVLVLPYRNPFLTAKAVASLDVVSGGRVILGVAPGYLEGEYAALGADFAERNAATDEALVAIGQAWLGESTSFEGRGFRADANTMLPRPVQRPHPPIWVGGNSRAAIRRAATHAQGWSPFPIPRRFAGRTRTAGIESVDDVRRGVERLNAYAREIGRSEPLDVNFVPFGAGMAPRALDPRALREQIAELACAGVTWVSLGVPGRSRAEVVDALARLGEQVVAG